MRAGILDSKVCNLPEESGLRLFLEGEEGIRVGELRRFPQRQQRLITAHAAAARAHFSTAAGCG